jgi:hypothetical protein
LLARRAEPEAPQLRAEPEAELPDVPAPQSPAVQLGPAVWAEQQAFRQPERPELYERAPQVSLVRVLGALRVSQPEAPSLRVLERPEAQRAWVVREAPQRLLSFA